MLKLRLSDTRSHAEEFQADSLSEFTLGLYQALTRYREHFERQHRIAPRPHLHIFPANTWGKWIDAGYGHGTHIVLYVEMAQNTSYLSDVWDRCQHAATASDQFQAGLCGLMDDVAREVNDD